MEPRKIKMLLHDDVVFQILQWLPVVSLLRFKLVCRTWRAMIERNDFIKQHLHRHHYDSNLKDENHSLIRIIEGKKSPFTFPLISIGSSEEPYACLQLDLSYLHEYFPLDVLDTVSYNGIICFSFRNCNGKYNICLWNPATRQSRVLPQSPAFVRKMNHFFLETTLGFGFDVKNHDCKVVSLCRKYGSNEGRVEMYSSGTDSWSSVTTVFPFRGWWRSPRIPFNNGTSFVWNVRDHKCGIVLCFDFSSEKLRFIPFPNGGDRYIFERYAIVVSDKIACVSHGHGGQTKICVLNGYGSVNESWVELYTVDPLSTIQRGYMLRKWLFMYENHLFFEALHVSGRNNVTHANVVVCGYNVVTKELKNFSIVGTCPDIYIKKESSYGLRISRDRGGPILLDFKESLLSVGKGSKETIAN